MTRHADTGIVAIGRNEGERLLVCLESARPHARHLVYVDSGSIDGSRERARALGAEVVELDAEIPFTAARARNAGFERLDALSEVLGFVQFIDGDCELEPGWMDKAREVLDEDHDVSVVCGRRRERFPQDTVYNLLCDMEWDTPIGEATECGGDALIRAEAFRAVGGYRPDLIAGEEPELCSRLSEAGGRIVRIDEPMTLHDARIDSIRQWWTRNVRAGHAQAEAASRGIREASARARLEVRSAILWGIALPLVALGSIGLGRSGVAFLIAAVYALQVLRIGRRRPKPRFGASDQYRYAVACVIGKLPNAQGQLRYWLGDLTGRRSSLIEYKGKPSGESPSRRDESGGSG